MKIKRLTKNTNKNEDIQFLQKKISRSNFKENNFLEKNILNEKNELSLNTFPQKNSKFNKNKNLNTEGKKTNQMQSILDDPIDKENFNNSKDIDNSNNYLNANCSKNQNEEQRKGKSNNEEETEIHKKNNDENPIGSQFNENNFDNHITNLINNNSQYLNQIKSNEINNNEVNPKKDNHKIDQNKASEQNILSHLNQNNIINSNNKINSNSNISEQIKDKDKDNENINKINPIKVDNIINTSPNFTEEEIELSKSIEKEFNEFTQNCESQIDKLIKTTIFFINNGFNERIRYMFYKCLINYGYPFIHKFNQFYNYFNAFCQNEKIKTPEKMYTELYCEYILKILSRDRSTLGKNKYISDFFFNGENIEIIINNLNLINDIKENIDSNHYYIQNFLEQNYDIIFKSMPNKINRDFSKAKPVFCKILSNIISRCDKSGYLNYRQLISSESVLFDGVKIKSQHNAKLNLKKMISIKLFGQEFGDKKFYSVLQDYFLHLFTIYKPTSNYK